MPSSETATALKARAQRPTASHSPPPSTRATSGTAITAGGSVAAAASTMSSADNTIDQNAMRSSAPRRSAASQVHPSADVVIRLGRRSMRTLKVVDGRTTVGRVCASSVVGSP